MQSTHKPGITATGANGFSVTTLKNVKHRRSCTNHHPSVRFHLTHQHSSWLRPSWPSLIQQVCRPSVAMGKRNKAGFNGLAALADV